MSDKQKEVSTNKGFFERWYDRIGRGAGLIKRAEAAEAVAMQEEVLDVGTSQGTFWRFHRERSKRRKYNIANISEYFQMYLDHDLIRNPVDDLIESAFGDGYYTTVEGLLPTMDSNKWKPFKAKTITDAFGEWFDIDGLNVNIGKLKMIAGFTGVETIIVRGEPEKSALKIIDPRSVRKSQGIETDPITGRVLVVHQEVGSEKNTIRHLGFNEDQTVYKGIAWFNYGKLGNDPRGTSYVRGATDLLNTIIDVQSDIDKILERYIGPLGIWTSTQDISGVKEAVLRREQGEDIFIGKVKPEDIEHLHEFLQIDPRIPYWEYQEYLDRRLYAYSRANNLWYSKDATVASAETLDKIVHRHVTAIQRDQKRQVEREWFEPLMIVNGIKIQTPRMNFGAEQTGLEPLDPSPIIVSGIELGFFDRPEYFDLLRQMGIDFAIKEAQETGTEEPEEEPTEKPLEDPEAPLPPEEMLYEFIRKRVEYHYTECMICHAPPTVEVIWGKGRFHSWFCDEHYNEWSITEMRAFKGYTYGEDIGVKRMLEFGVATKGWFKPLTESEADDWKTRKL